MKKKNSLSIHVHYSHFFANVMELFADDNLFFVDDNHL